MGDALMSKSSLLRQVPIAVLVCRPAAVGTRIALLPAVRGDDGGWRRAGVTVGTSTYSGADKELLDAENEWRLLDAESELQAARSR